MKRYETIVILDPDLSEDQRQPVFDRIGEIIPQQGGQLMKVEDWGARKLAYQIKKKPRGYYTLFDFCGAGPLVSEMERFLRIDDRVMKYMTVLTDPAVDIEALAQETSEAETEVEAPAAGEETPPADDAESATDQTEPAEPDVEPKEA